MKKTWVKPEMTEKKELTPLQRYRILFLNLDKEIDKIQERVDVLKEIKDRSIPEHIEYKTLVSVLKSLRECYLKSF